MGEYPWYKVVEGDQLEQGDLLRAIPILTPVPAPDLLAGEEMSADLESCDVVVITQSCDLAHGKINHVTVCPHWDVERAGEDDNALKQKGALLEIQRGRRHRYVLLERSSLEISMGLRIVDFSRVFSLPKPYVLQHARSQGKRLRLCPPYREHLAQGFARFFMRVGLPQDIQL